jgi:hypothetical protein
MPSKVEVMRDSLLLAIEQVKSGAMDPQKARSMAALAHQVTYSLDVELKVLMAAKVHAAASRLVEPVEKAKAIASGVVERDGAITRHTMG